jgi:hypothetical protein
VLFVVVIKIGRIERANCGGSEKTNWQMIEMISISIAISPILNRLTEVRVDGMA